MTPGPTNKGVMIAPLAADTEATVRAMCRDEGCICGDALKVEVTTLTPEQARKREAEGLPSGAQHCDVDIGHLLSCPLVARIQGRN